MMSETDELLNSIVLEMRRGVVILGVLSRLAESEYGYSLVQTLEQENFPVEPGTLYPLLRRLEKQGLLDSSWDTSENRPRKYYRLSDKGRKIYKDLIVEWQKISGSIAALVNGERGME
jgi:PadR family transcriptional regulator, regulatory protein PadR